MHILKTLALIVVASLGTLLFWKLGYGGDLLILLFLVSLAIVGEGNRLVWAAIFAFVGCIIAAGVYGAYELLPTPELLRLLLMFTLLTVIPGAILWVATVLCKRRSKAATATLITPSSSQNQESCLRSNGGGA
jgi:hypothetical protein